MKRSVSIGLLIGIASLPLQACAPMNSRRANSSPIQVASDPPGALVMYSAERPLDDKKAEVWGVTPLSRFVNSPQGTIRLSEFGYQEWEGTISESQVAFKAKLVRLSGAAGEPVASPSTDFLNVVPLRVGIRKIGEEGNVLEDSPEGKTFREEFVSKLSSRVAKRFGREATVERELELPDSTLRTIWGQMDDKVSKVRVEKIGYYPEPVRLDVDRRVFGAAAKAGGALVLVRGEAFYLGTGAKFARVAIPILLTAAGAAAGAAAAGAAGASFFVYPVFGPTPSSEAVIAQVYIVHPWTKELLWVGQAAAGGHYSDPAVVDGVIQRIVEAIPAKFAGGIPGEGDKNEGK